VLAFDLAADKQVCALTDPDSRVLAQRTVRVKAWRLDEAITWGLGKAAEAGFTSVVVARSRAVVSGADSRAAAAAPCWSRWPAAMAGFRGCR